MAGMNHKVAEIAIREKFYISMDIKTRALQQSPFDELLILATCNRTEIYVASEKPLCQEDLVRYVCGLVGENLEQYSRYFYYKEGEEAVRHVMNVCAGLDSVAMGEDQILHQIGRAYETAHQYGATGLALNKLFQEAIRTTKRIKTETNLSKLSCNIPFLAMKQVQKTFGDLENKTVYIVGLGEMGSLMLKYVQENTTKIFASQCAKVRGRVDSGALRGPLQGAGGLRRGYPVQCLPRTHCYEGRICFRDNGREGSSHEFPPSNRPG